MFCYANDESHAVAVWRMCGSHNSDDDYERYIQRIENAKSVVHAMPAAILIIEAGNPIPSARWRREIAAATRGIPSTMLFALCTQSPLVRGVFTAIQWLRPSSYQTSTHTHFASAREWIETERREPLPVLDELRRAVQNKRVA